MTINLYISDFIQLSQKGLIWKDNDPVKNSEHQIFKDFLKGLYQHFDINYSKYFKMDTLSKLGFLTSEILMRNKMLLHKPEEIAQLFFNSEATMKTDQEYLSTIQNIASPAIFVYTLPNIVMGEISIRNKFRGENLFFIEKNFDAHQIYEQVNLLFTTTDTTACLTGWINYIDQNDFNATLYLIERIADSQKYINFDAENIDKIFKGEI